MMVLSATTVGTVSGVSVAALPEDEQAVKSKLRPISVIK